MDTRSVEPELMDSPTSDKKRLFRTLDQFELVNTFFTRMHGLLKRVILEEMCNQPHRTYSVADFGCGGGDCARWLARAADKLGLSVRITGIDADPRVVEYARKACSGFSRIDIVKGGLETLSRRFDYVYANHLLHHLPDPLVSKTLRLINDSSRRGFLVNDLRRSRWAYLGYTALSGVFLRNSFAFSDGRLSIRRGFTLHEVCEHVQEAGLQDYVEVKACVPARVVITRSRLALERETDNRHCAWPRFVVHHLHGAVM